MAIPSRGIGWSEQSNLLWQISKELERLTCVMAGGCTTTTTTTTSAITNYNVAGCERMEYHVISYTGGDVLPEGTIVNNDTPECWSIIDQTTNPADVGTITYVWPTLGDCTPCIDSHTTTTTTTSIPLVIQNGAFIPFVPCEQSGSVNAVQLYLEQSCIDNLTVGCHIYSDQEGTINAPEGYYQGWNGVSYFYIDANGLVLNIDVCPQPIDDFN
jgi:hypothetical protein